MKRIYLDHNATSPLRKDVQNAIEEFMQSEGLANANSIHQSGKRIRKYMDDARESVANLIHCSPSEIIFTSGGTESNHLSWKYFQQKGMKILTSEIEHPCVLDAAKEAEEKGAQVFKIRFFPDGSFQLPSEDHFDFISLQWANNETGMVLPLEQILSLLKADQTSIHVDAVQAVGKLDVDLTKRAFVNYLSISGHKLGALPGVGALYVQKGSKFASLWQGGPQEKGRRPGTENILGIISLGAAARTIQKNRNQEEVQIQSLKDWFENSLKSAVPQVQVLCDRATRLPNTSNVLVSKVEGEDMVISLDLEGIDISTGSACTSGSLEPSHVIMGLGYPEVEAKKVIRVSMGWSTTKQELEKTLEILPKVVERLRKK